MVGGGSGSIQPLLNANKSLLRKKSYLKDKDKSIPIKDAELEFIELPNEELELLKKKIRVEANNHNFLHVLSVIFMVIILGFMTHYFLQENDDYEEYIANKNYQLRLKEFNVNIKKGDEFYYTSHYKNALFFYRKSLALFPENSLVKTKMKNCYRLQCENENINCTKLLR